MTLMVFQEMLQFPQFPHLRVKLTFTLKGNILMHCTTLNKLIKYIALYPGVKHVIWCECVDEQHFNERSGDDLR